MAKKPKSIVEQLRAAIAQAEKAGTTRYRLAKISGLSEAVLSRFVNGKTRLHLDTAETIAAALNLKLSLAIR